MMRNMKLIHFLKSMTNQPLPNSNSTIEWIIAQERLRQARHSFNLALTTTAVSFCISLVGAGLLMLDKVPSGAITSAMGLVSSVRYFEFAKDANDRLDKILDESENNN
jgi:CHASE2 domain-containing sensor protein